MLREARLDELDACADWNTIRYAFWAPASSIGYHVGCQRDIDKRAGSAGRTDQFSQPQRSAVEACGALMGERSSLFLEARRGPSWGNLCRKTMSPILTCTAILDRSNVIRSCPTPLVNFFAEHTLHNPQDKAHSFSTTTTRHVKRLFSFCWCLCPRYSSLCIERFI